MNNEATALLYEQVFNTIPIGLFLVSQDQTIYAWNTWMAYNTQIKAEQAIGQPLKSVFTDTINVRFAWALEAVLLHSHPQILSSAFNKHSFTIPPVTDVYPNLNTMQQHVEILPVPFLDQNMALIVIQNVTDNVHLKKTLISMAARLEVNSFIDALTGLYNRRFLWKNLSNELLRAHREEYNVYCGLFDIDHFKKINDELGHPAGDEVLVSFSKIAQTIVRPNDYLVRYGGEEFLLTITKTKVDDAIEIFNRLRKKIEAAPSHGNVNRIITCSGGVSCWQPSDPIISAEELVEKADIELYKAKNNGRNCISFMPKCTN